MPSPWRGQNASVTSMNSTGSIPADAFSLRSPYGRRAIGLSVAAAVGGFLFGFDSSVINGAVDSISKDFALGDVITGFVVAIARFAYRFLKSSIASGRSSAVAGRVPS